MSRSAKQPRAAGRRPRSVSLAVEELESRDLLSPATLAVASAIVHSPESLGDFVADEYNRFLKRSPDASGFQNWVGQLQNGTDPAVVEAAFVASGEYLTAHGNDFRLWLTSLYQDLFGRDPDAAGLSNWLSVLAAGRHPQEVALGFTTSRERQGLVITDDYARFLGRSPEPGAVDGWLNVEAQGNDRAEVASGIVASDEFFAAHSGTPLGFIVGAYQAVLGRTPSTQEVNGWLTVYNQVAGGSGAAAQPGAFNIALRTTGLTPSEVQVFRQAAARWEQVITGDLPDATYQGVAVDDLLIDASAQAIDGSGGVLGESSPDAFRSGSQLPIHGTMEFDTADLASLEANGELYDVVLHEMAHVLGFGTLWRSLGLLSGAGTTNPRFLGAHATAEYDALFGTNETSVPVEGRPSPSGSRNSHWRESVFGNELMTPYISGTTHPLSRVTLASLADLGYTVNLSAADPYTPL
jgi:hypothetical protein